MSRPCAASAFARASTAKAFSSPMRSKFGTVFSMAFPQFSFFFFPSPLVGEGGREQSERPGEGALKLPLSRLAASSGSAPSPTRGEGKRSVRHRLGQIRGAIQRIPAPKSIRQLSSFSPIRPTCTSAMRITSKMIATDQPISKRPFSDVIGPIRRLPSGALGSP